MERREGKKPPRRLTLSTKRYKNKGLSLKRWREKSKEGEKRSGAAGDAGDKTNLEKPVSLDQNSVQPEEEEDKEDSASSGERLEESTDQPTIDMGSEVLATVDDTQETTCQPDEEESDDDVTPFAFLECEIGSWNNLNGALVESLVDQEFPVKTEQLTIEERLGTNLGTENDIQEVASSSIESGKSIDPEQVEMTEMIVNKAENIMTSINEQFICPVCKKFKVGEEIISVPARGKCKCSTPKRRKPKKQTYKCEKCDKVYDYPSHLERHETSHIEVKPYACSKCVRTFCQQWELDKHFNTHSKRKRKPYVCSECGKRFSIKSSLSRHALVHSKVKPYRCNSCGDYFATKTKLLYHLQIHLGVKPFGCEECGLSFSQKSYLSKHIKIHSGVKLYMCKKCGKSFFDEATLNRHVRSRACNKVFKCADCNQSFPKKSILVNHLRSHEEKTLVRCDECGRSFTNKSRLHVHLKTHLEKKPFSCTICTKSFLQQYKLNKHILRTH